MSEKSNRTNIEKHPDFGLDPTDRINKLKSFFKTKSAIINDERLFEYGKNKLVANGYMGPWQFNLTESVIATIPALAVLKILEFLFPAPSQEAASELEQMIGSIVSWLEPFFIPLSLFIIAWSAGWASLLKEERTKEKVRMATFAYLYYNGAHGLIAQALLVFGLTLSAFIDKGHLPEIVAGSLNLVLLPIMLIGLFRTIFVTGKRIPNKLWELHGYSSKKNHFWRKRDNAVKYAPHSKYALVVGICAPSVFFLLALLIGSIIGVFAMLLINVRHVLTG